MELISGALFALLGPLDAGSCQWPPVVRERRCDMPLGPPHETWVWPLRCRICISERLAATLNRKIPAG